MTWSPLRAWRARRMMRRLRELDRLDARHGLGAAVPRRNVGRSREWVPYVAAPLVLIAIAVAVPGGLPVEVRRLVGVGPERLAPAIETTTSGAHAFMHRSPGTDRPVTWDPCKPVRYEVNPKGGPSDATDLVREAAAVTSGLTGLRFEYVGTTDSRPAWDRPFIPTLGSNRKPALVSWATAKEVPALEGDVAGVGGAAAVEDDHGRMHLKGGGVTLDIESFNDMEMRPDARDVQRRVVLHEFGHLVGLGHVKDLGELMHPGGPALRFGPGDREGLAILGQGECG